MTIEEGVECIGWGVLFILAGIAGVGLGGCSSPREPNLPPTTFDDAGPVVEDAGGPSGDAGTVDEGLVVVLPDAGPIGPTPFCVDLVPTCEDPMLTAFCAGAGSIGNVRCNSAGEVYCPIAFDGVVPQCLVDTRGGI